MTKTRRLIVTTLALVATLLGSIAADASTESGTVGADKRASCAEAPSGELAECLGVQIAIAETELSVLFKTLLTREAKNPSLSRLKDAQSKWRDYRDAQCELAGLELRDYENRLNPATQQCRLHMTDERIAALRSLSLPPLRAHAVR